MRFEPRPPQEPASRREEGAVAVRLREKLGWAGGALDTAERVSGTPGWGWGSPGAPISARLPGAAWDPS